jgi:Arc/MetJ-type ribon-helix-helix transcriptional regulator
MHPVDLTPESASSADAANVNRLEPMLVRLPPPLAAELRSLARKTRVRQSDYLREAVADLLAKYGHLPVERSTM